MGTGVSVFPQPQLLLGSGPVPGTQNGGLTKRELFAAMAMQGVIAKGYVEVDVVARGAVAFADALLAALEAKG